MKRTVEGAPYKPLKGGTVLVLLALVVLLAVVPMLFLKDAEFGGADGEAEVAITEISPDYQPWFTPLWEPPSGEIESLFFSMQAALGAGIIGYAIGYWRGRREKSGEKR